MDEIALPVLSNAGQTAPVLDGRVITTPPAAADTRAAGRLDLGTYLDRRRLDDERAARLRALAADAAGFLQASHAPATLTKYATGWRHLLDFARDMGLPTRLSAETRLPLTPVDMEICALYLAQCAADEMSMSTLDGRLAAIRHFHHEAGLTSPTDHPEIRRLRRGIRRTQGADVEHKHPISLPLLAAMLTARGARHPQPAPHPASRPATRRTWLLQQRDRALLLIGFFAGLRRSELAALNADDLELRDEGIRITIRRSKADQEGKGQFVDLPRVPDALAGLRWLCPVQAILVWLEISGRRPHLRRQGQRSTSNPAPLFSAITKGGNITDTHLNAVTIKRAVKNAAAASGQPREVIDAIDAVSAHSLRAGLATAASMAAIEEASIGRVLRHTQTTTTAYIHPPFDGTLQLAVYHLAVERFGLGA